MAVFQYEVMNRQGDIQTGQISAADEAAALARLQENGFVVTEIAQQKDRAQKKSGRNKKVKVADLALFSRQLAAMLSAGIPVTQSIDTLSRQTENATLCAALEGIASAVEAGSNLTDAFSLYPKVFSPLYVGMIHAGEVGGILETALLRLSVQLQKEKQLNDNIKSATSYPKMIGAFAILMFVAMIVGLVPVFEGFISPDVEITGLTKVTFGLSHSIRSYWYIWILCIAVIIFALRAFTKSKTGHDLWENNKMRMPIFGELIQKSTIARFSRTLATLLQGGIPVVQALQSAGPTAGSDLLKNAVNRAVEKIEAGKNISSPLEESGLFPPMVINMIAIGEEAGTLPELLDKVAEFYEEDVATMTKNLGSVIEPIMLILIGIIVGGMLLSLYLPIFTAVTSST